MLFIWYSQQVQGHFVKFHRQRGPGCMTISYLPDAIYDSAQTFLRAHNLLLNRIHQMIISPVHFVQGSTSGSGPSGVMAFGFISA